MRYNIDDFAQVSFETYRAAMGSALATMTSQERLTVDVPTDKPSHVYFVSADGLAGFFVDAGTTVCGAFRSRLSRRSGVGRVALDTARNYGAHYLYCYETVMPIYVAAGAVEIARYAFDEALAPAGWDTETMGRPAFIEMRF